LGGVVDDDARLLRSCDGSTELSPLGLAVQLPGLGGA